MKKHPNAKFSPKDKDSKQIKQIRKHEFFSEHRDVLVSSFLSGVLIMTSVIVAMRIADNYKNRVINEKKYINLLSQEKYWRNVVEKYPLYRDGLLKYAVINYEIGDKVKARKFANKALEIDQDSKKAKDLLVWIEDRK